MKILDRPPTVRILRIRHGADAPPLPMGCRWCGHPPYAHDDARAMPGRPHRWQHPTAAQMGARMTVRRRLGLRVPPAGRGRSPYTPARSRREPQRRVTA